MPDFASRRDATTSCVLLPMDETMPIPVTTTRLMKRSSFLDAVVASERPPSILRQAQDEDTNLALTLSLSMGEGRLSRRCRCGGGLRQRGCGVAEQADLQILHFEGEIAVDPHDAVGDAQDELAHDHALELDIVGELAGGRQNHAGEFDIADAECAALAKPAGPAKEKADHLPERIESEAAGHHRIVLEMAFEEPQVRVDI